MLSHFAAFNDLALDMLFPKWQCVIHINLYHEKLKFTEFESSIAWTVTEILDWKILSSHNKRANIISFCACCWNSSSTVDAATWGLESSELNPSMF